jgi:Mg-chelatase subunit ChlD
MLLCAAATEARAQVCEEPNVVIILDRSGSMLEGNKWGQALNAVRRLTSGFEDRIRFGLLVFPFNGQCSVWLDDGALRAPVLPRNSDNIMTQLGRVGPERSNKTPLGGGVAQGQIYLATLDDRIRRNFLVVITDGMETCNGNPINSAQNAAIAGYPVFVIGFGSGVDGNVLNQMATVGGTERAYQANNEVQLTEALEEIARRASDEVCDGRDNDCDGQIDENLGEQPCSTPCGDGVQVCTDGQLSQCIGGNIPQEVCDGQDNDCDEAVDEIPGVPCMTPGGNPGTAACVGGAPQADCTPDNPEAEEICDGRDNDADLQIDEDTDQPCMVECHAGRRICVEGNLIRCTAPPVGPEICNGEDDDCDGNIDEMVTCAGEAVCGEEGECLEPCRNNECPGDYQCLLDGFCHPLPCDPGCPMGWDCVERTCKQPCVVDRDCSGPGEGCAPDSYCAVVPGGDGMGGPGPLPPPTPVLPDAGPTDEPSADGESEGRGSGETQCAAVVGHGPPRRPTWWLFVALLGLSSPRWRRRRRPR